MIAIKTLIELAVVLLLIYGFIREKDVIAFEERMRATLRKKVIKAVRRWTQN